jgi:osomolarity two-component system sensor histidine kinase NIK1
MAAVLPGVNGSSVNASPFEQHILSVLAACSEQASPSYPFPDQPTLTPFTGTKTPVQEAIENAIISLGQRTWTAERHPPNVHSQHVTNMPTPAWTPPVADNTPAMCSTCTRPLDSAFQTTFSSHPLAASLSTPPAQLSSIRPIPGAPVNPNPHSIITTSNGASVLTGGPGAASWGVRGSVGESGMTAEKELELLKAQVQDIARVCKAVATGDLTQKIIVPVEGQAMTELKDIINSMVDRLKTFAVEVERVSLEVGTQGKLGGQAVVEGVEGTWRELTAVVNKLAANLTSQVRSIAKVTKAVAKGDLSETIDVEASGEIAELKTTVNGMVSEPLSFAEIR